MKFDLHDAMLKENAQLRKSLAATQAELEKARQLAEDRLQQMQSDRSQALGWKVDAERYRIVREQPRKMCMEEWEPVMLTPEEIDANCDAARSQTT